VVEFCALGVLLMLPVVYLVVAMGRIEAASFAVDGSAREAARAFVTARTEAEGRTRAAAAVRLGLLDQGFDVPVGDALSIACSKDPCLTPGGEVTAKVVVRVALPGVPALIDRVVPIEVTVRSEQVDMVDAFRPRGPRS
jgi:fructose-specific phosphotransferase system IIC component